MGEFINVVFRLVLTRVYLTRANVTGRGFKGSALRLERIIIETAHPLTGLGDRNFIARIGNAILRGLNFTGSIVNVLPNMLGGGNSVRIFNGKGPIFCVGKRVIHGGVRIRRLGTGRVSGVAIVAGPDSHCTSAMNSVVGVAAVGGIKSNFSFSGVTAVNCHGCLCNGSGLSLGCEVSGLSIFKALKFRGNGSAGSDGGIRGS